MYTQKCFFFARNTFLGAPKKPSRRKEILSLVRKKKREIIKIILYFLYMAKAKKPAAKGKKK